MANATLEGGCLCGAVRYRASGETHNSAFCHCDSCKRAAGSPVVAWVTFRPENFAFTRGAPASYRSSPPVERTFCGSCGTPLTYQHASFADEIDVTIASLDDPSAIAPADHIWTSERIAWFVIGDRLPQHARSRGA